MGSDHHHFRGLVRAGDLADDVEGIEIVIELRADANPQIVLNNLFKYTAAQSTFPVNMVALVDGVPRTINLQDALQAWLDHQIVVLTRRTQYRLERAEARLHIVEGLLKAPTACPFWPR